MKKENVVKKILMKAIVGFPVGVTLLITAYASIYFIASEEMFNTELNQLHNINTFISQIVSAGISGYLLFVNFYTLSIIQNKELENKLMAEHPYKSVFTIIISSMYLIIILIMTLGNIRIFSKNLSALNIIILAIIHTLSGIVFFIKNAIEQHWIKEINQKIKERNS